MSYPVEVFPASELPLRLLSHATRTTKTTNVGTTVKIRKEPITAETLSDKSQCSLLRMFQYECRILEGGGYRASRLTKEQGKKLLQGGEADTVHVKCFPVERLMWKCGDNLMIDGTASELAHRQAAQASNTGILNT